MLATRTASLEPPDAIFARCARAAYRTPPVAALTDRRFWHVGAAAAIFIEFVWQIATNGRAQSVRTPGRPRAPLGPPVELFSPFQGFGSDARGRHADICAHPNRRPRSVTARYQRPAGCLGSGGIPAGPGGPPPPPPPLFTWPRGPRMAQNSSKHVPAPQKWPSCARQKLILTAPLLNLSRWTVAHMPPPHPRLTLASGTLKLAGYNVRRGGGRARFIHLLGLRRGGVSLVAWGAKKMVVISAIAQGVEWIWERQNW